MAKRSKCERCGEKADEWEGVSVAVARRCEEDGSLTECRLDCVLCEGCLEAFRLTLDGWLDGWNPVWKLVEL